MALVRRRRRGSPAEHANAENSTVGPNNIAKNGRYVTIADGAAVTSQAITITKKCLIVVVSTCVQADNAPRTQIQRSGVDKTKESTMTAVDFAWQGGYACLQYATELLQAGTYTFSVINVAGADWSCYGCTMKIVAVSVG